MSAANLDLTAILAAQPDPAMHYYGPGPGPWSLQVRGPQPPSAVALFATEQNGESVEAHRFQIPRECNGVCMIEPTEGSPIMCGQIYHCGFDFWRHMRQAHTGAVAVPARLPIPAAEMARHVDLLQHQFVLTGRWREASFSTEPGRGPPGYVLTRIADEFEKLAAADSQFAATFGTKFHRRDPDVPDIPLENGIELLLRAAAVIEGQK